jgi:YD repeat-containing protein
LGFAAPLQASVPARVSSWTYNAAGQVLTSTDPAGATSTQTYYTDTTTPTSPGGPNAPMHQVGDLASSSNALGHVTLFGAYNAAGNVLASTDANGVTTTYVYDARQRLVSSTVGGGGAGGLTTTRSYTLRPVAARDAA